LNTDTTSLRRWAWSRSEVAAAVRRLCVDASDAARAQRREGARARWAADFDAERNHLRFARRMRELMQSLDEALDET